MQSRKPAWWQLYLLVPIMFGLIALERLLPLPRASDAIVDAAIVVLTYGAMLFWVHINGGLLERYEMERDTSLRHLTMVVYEPICRTEDANVDWKERKVFTLPRAAIQARVGALGVGEDEAKWSLN
jgi:hypothetical protein